MQRALKARRMTDHEAAVRLALRRLPARPTARGADGVETQAGDDHEDVAVVGVDRDPLAGAGIAPAHEAARGERRAQYARARKREGDGAGAVVARVLPGAVAAAPLVRRAG